MGVQLKITGNSLIYLGHKSLGKYEYQPRFITSGGINFQLGGL